MEIDKKTQMDITVVIDNKPKLLNKLKQNGINIVGKGDFKNNPQFWFNEDIGKLVPDEYYLEDNSLHYSGSCKTDNGDIYVSIDLPLSDVILMDIIKDLLEKSEKLKNLKNTLEVLQ